MCIDIDTYISSSWIGQSRLGMSIKRGYRWLFPVTSLGRFLADMAFIYSCAILIPALLCALVFGLSYGIGCIMDRFDMVIKPRYTGSSTTGIAANGRIITTGAIVLILIMCIVFLIALISTALYETLIADYAGWILRENSIIATTIQSDTEMLPRGSKIRYVIHRLLLILRAIIITIIWAFLTILLGLTVPRDELFPYAVAWFFGAFIQFGIFGAIFCVYVFCGDVCIRRWKQHVHNIEVTVEKKV